MTIESNEFTSRKKKRKEKKIPKGQSEGQNEW